VLVASEGDDKSQQVVDQIEITRVGDALGLDNQQTLKRVYNFLNLLPLVRVFAQLQQIALYYLVDSLIFFNEYQQQIMSCFPDLGLNMLTATF